MAPVAREDGGRVTVTSQTAVSIDVATKLNGALLPFAVVVVGLSLLLHLRHEVRRGGDLIDLSPTEYRLLHYLMAHQGQVLSRSQILEAVWQYDFGGDSVVVERFVSNLRRKIDHGRDHPLLHTVRGVGYTLRKQAVR